MKFLPIILTIHVLTIAAFEVEECPGGCNCKLDDHSLMYVDCSELNLSELPEFPDNQIHFLDVSKNEFTAFPPQLDKFDHLQYLDISNNHISRLKGNALNGLTSLRLLNLEKNNISSWLAINPRNLLEPVVSLTELSLAGNPLTSFSTNDETLLLVSNSLTVLDLSHCKITKVQGEQVLQGMKDLQTLILAHNQIRSVSDLISDTLVMLDLSHNRLTNLLPNMLLNLPALTYLDLSRNHRISLQNKQGEFVVSDSLKKIDLSYNNMDDVELEGFSALKIATLRGNMIRALTTESFVNTQTLEKLDLSQNALNSVDVNTFKKLKHLKHLNLSFNMISRIERDTFKDNELLMRLDLSRNTISRFNRITLPALTHLNMTWCQITKIDPDAIHGMPELIDLDLSNNLFTDFPDLLSSENLAVLDLSMNRMVNIRNATFANFPEITKINLSGNRFTVPFKAEFFAENYYLSELQLGDNPWLCNCHELQNFYTFITEAPAKVWEKQNLRCQSPEDVAGRTWESACYFTWYPQSRMGTTEKVWTFFMVSVIAFSGCMCLIMTIRRGIEGRRQTRREEERERNLEEGRDIIRQNRVRMQQEAQRDAPDPRETRPPCYSEAILMPRLDGSFASLDELGSGRLKHKRRRRKTEEPEDDEIHEEEVPIRRNRCRSEEVLSMREIVAASTRSPIIVPRVHPTEIEPINRNESTGNEPDELHYLSTDILTMDHSPRHSRARSEQVSQREPPPATESFEGIRNFNNQSSNTLERSPYSKRKLSNLGSFKSQRPETTSNPQGIDMHEDHFKTSDRESVSSSEFITITAGNHSRNASSASSNEDGLIVLRKPTDV